MSLGDSRIEHVNMLYLMADYSCITFEMGETSLQWTRQLCPLFAASTVYNSPDGSMN